MEVLFVSAVGMVAKPDIPGRVAASGLIPWPISGAWRPPSQHRVRWRACNWRVMASPGRCRGLPPVISVRRGVMRRPCVSTCRDEFGVAWRSCERDAVEAAAGEQTWGIKACESEHERIFFSKTQTSSTNAIHHHHPSKWFPNPSSSCSFPPPSQPHRSDDTDSSPLMPRYEFPLCSWAPCPSAPPGTASGR
jgi:hypothetical protein